MRGKALSHICCCRVSWITPAYAGKSKPSWSGQACMAGSPPPMRGKAAHLRCRSLRSGITPAYAGKSGAPAISPVMMTDHPRLCGEKSSPFCAPCAIRGSPPPMRGKAFLVCQCDYSTGITPAYAGKSLIPVFFGGRFEDHPRLCGEKHSTLVIRSRRLGSPPPMRGKDEFDMDEVDDARITPAYAGKSSPHTYPQ